MARIRKKFTRRSGFRDAKLFVIATEGQKTEPKYFKDFASREYYYNPHVHVEILERLTPSSSPVHVLEELNKFKSKYNLISKDELWMIIDLDRWHQRNLSDVATQCSQKGYHLAVSNPCFEVWLLLHLKDLSDYSIEEINRFTQNFNRDLEREIRNILGSYNKSNPDTLKFLPLIHDAIKRAKNLDQNPHDRWPNSIGTRVYLLAQKIITY